MCFILIVAVSNIHVNAGAQTTTTTVPPACDITINPESETVYTWETVQFSATVSGNCNDPCYTWEIMEIGIGLITRKANIRIVSEILLSWVLTLPIAAILSGFIYWILNI